MFSKAKQPSGTATPMPDTSSNRAMTRSASPSIISADLRIVGDMISTGDIQVDGTVEGDIQSRSVTIGESAQVHGSIAGDTVRICGSVNGQIKGQTVTLDKTARVQGDILHASLAIEPGAYLEGMCKRIDATADSRVSSFNDKDRDEPVAAAANG